MIQYELYSLYRSFYLVKIIKSRRLRWTEHLATVRGSKSALKTGKPIGNVPLGRHRCRWEDKITMAFKECGISIRNLIESHRIMATECDIEPLDVISHAISLMIFISKQSSLSDSFL